ncbi:Cupin -type [Pyrenophora seminiperda CCB06]|uniref:Cupin-type n=1 Tax=Pyrenophora seminiperda CCB06 TaxID=1302712 RepID=A0A3M7MJD0_9PLEO|nr:Cupin -type [Pyrenophora seminiperda CCB06]
MPEPTALTPLPHGTQPVIRHGPQAVVYHIPTSSPSPTHPTLKTTISLPVHSTWTSGLHFHTQHTEYLRLLKGSIFVYLDGEVQILSAKAGGLVCLGGHGDGKSGLQLTVEKYARHEWGRAKEYLAPRISGGKVSSSWPEDIDDDVVVEEWTDPVDIGKALFFWNLNGIILTPNSAKLSPLERLARYLLGDYWISFQLFSVFWCLDNWPVFFSLKGGLGEQGITMAVLGFMRLVGWIIGVKAVESRRTPWKLWKAYEEIAA